MQATTTLLQHVAVEHSLDTAIPDIQPHNPIPIGANKSTSRQAPEQLQTAAHLPTSRPKTNTAPKEEDQLLSEPLCLLGMQHQDVAGVHHPLIQHPLIQPHIPASISCVATPASHTMPSIQTSHGCPLPAGMNHRQLRSCSVVTPSTTVAAAGLRQPQEVHRHEECRRCCARVTSLSAAVSVLALLLLLLG